MYRVNQQPQPTGYGANPQCVPSSYAPAPSRPTPQSQQRYPYGGSGGQAPGPPTSMPQQQHPQQQHHHQLLPPQQQQQQSQHNGMMGGAGGMNGHGCMPPHGQGPNGSQQQQQQQQQQPMSAGPPRYAASAPQWQQFTRNGVPPPQPPPGPPPRSMPAMNMEMEGVGGMDLSSMRQWPSSMHMNGGPLRRTGSYNGHTEEGSALSSRQSSVEDLSSRTTSEDTSGSAGTASSLAMGGAGAPNILTVLGPEGATRKRVRLTSEERIQRSRERNRVHARKTRKRKKVQMESIQCMIENLQEEARRMRLAVMEWYTANILLVMRSPEDAGNASDKQLLTKYMKVQAFLERNQQRKEGDCLSGGSDDSGSTKDDPDGRTSSESTQGDEEDGLMGQPTAMVPAVQHPWNKGTTRTRCKYAPEDRERIRRERNRIHAKRTRDRRKKFMEDSEKVLASLATENKELRELLCMIYDHNPDSTDASNQQHAAAIAAAQQQGITATANGVVMNGFQGGEEKPNSKGNGGMYFPQQQQQQARHPSGTQAGGAALMALSMQQHPGSLPRPILVNGEGSQQYSRSASLPYGRIKPEDYEDFEDEDEEDGSESDEDDYEGEDDEDQHDARPYRKQRTASYPQHGREADTMQADSRLYSPNARGAVRG